MQSAQLTIEGQNFDFPLKSIEGTGLSNYIYQDGNVLRIRTPAMSANKIKVVHSYLVNGILPKISDLDAFIDTGIKRIHSYELANLVEKDMRDHMYLPGHEKRYSDPTYGLNRITEQVWSKIKAEKLPSNDLLFFENPLKKAFWDTIQEKLDMLKPFFSIPGVFIAGGAIFSILFDLPISDIDVFLYGCTPVEAEEKILQLIEACRIANYLKESPKCEVNWEKNVTKVVRTSNAITFPVVKKKLYSDETLTGKINVQIITRLYKTPSEVIHGFDVDCCSIGYNGENLLMTDRARFALENGYNTVNLEYLSPSYSYRLAKYGSRGMGVKVSGFDRSKINQVKLQNDYELHEPGKGVSYDGKFYHLLKKTGLDILLYLEFFDQKSKYKLRSQKSLRIVAEEHSDYSINPIGDISNLRPMKDILEYLLESADNYEEKSNQYLPLFLRSEVLGKMMRESRFIDSEPVNPNLQRELRVCQKHGPYSVTPKVQFDYCVRCKGENARKNNIECPSECTSCIIPLSGEDAVDAALNLNGGVNMSNIPASYRIYAISTDVKHIQNILHVPRVLYDIFAVVRPWNFSQNLEWKTTKPGEQMTNTFKRIVLEDNSQWYNGTYYQM